MNSFMNLIEPLFAFVVESSLAACIAVVVILVLQRVFRARFSPRWHYLLWSLLVLRLMLPWMPESPVSAERLFRFASHETVISSPEVHRDFAANRFVPFTDNAPESAREATASPVAPSVPIKPVRRPLDLSRVMKSVWLAGCLLFGLHIVTVSWRMSRNWRTVRPVTDARVRGVFEDCKKRMKVGGRPALLSDDNLAFPVVCGIIRPRLIVPSSMLHTLSDCELRHVFLHELSHLRRRDLLVGLLTAGLQTLHWFNPLVWYAFHRMRQDREFACDALALSRMTPEEADGYGHTLIKLMENGGRPIGFAGAAAILEEESQLLTPA